MVWLGDGEVGPVENPAVGAHSLWTHVCTCTAAHCGTYGHSPSHYSPSHCGTYGHSPSHTRSVYSPCLLTCVSLGTGQNTLPLPLPLSRPLLLPRPATTMATAATTTSATVATMQPLNFYTTTSAIVAIMQPLTFYANKHCVCVSRPRPSSLVAGQPRHTDALVATPSCQHGATW